MVFPSVGQVRDQCFSAIVPPRCKVRCCSLSLGQPINNPPIYTLRADFVRYKCEEDKKTLPKAQRTRGLSSYHKITVHKSWTYVLQFQNLNKALTSKSQPSISISTKSKVKILPKPSFRILTKIQLRNLNQTSAAKYWPDFSFKISPEQLQNLD